MDEEYAEIQKKVGKALAGCSLLFGVLIIKILLNTIVIANLWDWFIAPWLDMPKMPLTSAFGLELLVRIFMLRAKDFSAAIEENQYRESLTGEEREVWEEGKTKKDGRILLFSFLIPLTVLFLGWIASLLT